MKTVQFDSLFEAINGLTKNGYSDDFKLQEDHIFGVYSKKKYQPKELKITATYRFDGMTNPSDESEIFAIEAKDGNKGTMVLSYSFQKSENSDLLKHIKHEEITKESD